MIVAGGDGHRGAPVRHYTVTSAGRVCESHLVLIKLAARDLLIAALLVGVWTTERRFMPGDGALFWVLSIAAGLGYAVMGFLLHEWGHLTGSRLAGAVVHPAPRLFSPLLFHFDTSANDRRQFLWMSMGGYAVSAAWLTFVLATADTARWSGRIALGFVVIGAIGTVVAEVPTTLRVWRGAPLPTGAAYRKQS